jgi:4-amino-4-deoxy-L-arabinose transferase-like glycosyltransferase
MAAVGHSRFAWAALLVESAAAFSALMMGLRDPATSVLGFALFGMALISVGARLAPLSPWRDLAGGATQPAGLHGPLPTLIALVLLYGLMLGATPLFDVDEGAFAESARYMLQSGDWLHTTLLGVDRFDKPILVYWLQAASLAVFGPSEFAARLPSAIAVVSACMAVGYAMTERWGPVVAWRAAFILGTCPGLLLIGRASTADGLLNALLMGTALSLLAFVQTGRIRSLRWAYFWCGLGLLTKGPVAILVPGAALLLWSLVSDRGRTAIRALAHWPGWLILLAVAAPWYVYAFLRHGEAFINGFLVRHNLERFMGTLEGHGGSVGYYVLLLPILLLPWFPLLLQALRRARSHWSEPSTRFLLLWAGFVFGFFSLSGTKLPHYLLYGIPPLAILMAIESTRIGPWGRWAMAVSIAVFLLVVPAIPLLADRWGSEVRDEWIRHLLATAPAHADLLVGFCVLALLLVGAALVRRRWDWWQQQQSVAAVALLWTTLLVPWVGHTLQEPFRLMANWARAQRSNVVQWQMNQPSVAFYRQGPAPRRAPEPGEAALVRSGRADLTGPEFEVLHEHRGLRWVLRKTQ